MVEAYSWQFSTDKSHENDLSNIERHIFKDEKYTGILKLLCFFTSSQIILDEILSCPLGLHGYPLFQLVHTSGSLLWYSLLLGD